MPSLSPIPEIEVLALKENSPSKALELLRGLLKDDSRAGAKRLLAKFERRLALSQKEFQRLEKIWVYEKEGQSKGFVRIAGVDEAGRGPLAGPVVAAAVILPPDGPLTGLDDSKKLTHAKREELFPQIKQAAVGVGVGQASVQEIDKLNIY